MIGLDLFQTAEDSSTLIFYITITRFYPIPVNDYDCDWTKPITYYKNSSSFLLGL